MKTAMLTVSNSAEHAFYRRGDIIKLNDRLKYIVISVFPAYQLLVRKYTWFVRFRLWLISLLSPY